ncbi:MAG: hypothetical protein IT366_10625 [Candidatus Hydrogenedentes bacterium]|nr:hypothetical protein [Candidatus Hydrogenedentota bacterium]
MGACPICGVALMGQAKQCAVCGADLASAGALAGDILAAPVRQSVAPAKPPAPSKIDYKRLVIRALLSGWACAAVLGVVAGVLMHLIIGDQGDHTALKSGLNFGGMLGFLVGSIWAVTSTLELGLGMAALVGCVLGAVDTTLHYFGESYLIAPPDVATYVYTFMGAIAGSLAGAFSVVLRNYRENA